VYTPSAADTAHGGVTIGPTALNVNTATPSLATVIKDSSGTAVTSVTNGTAVHDTATLTNGFQASGMVTYTFFTNGGCTGTGTVVSTVTVSPGSVPDSAATTPATTGSFSFQASYGGDANNNAATSVCETLTVTSVTGQPILLTFSAFDADDLVNGVGQLQVLVNGHIVVEIPAGTGTIDNATLDNRWVDFGPFNIAALINSSQVQQVIVFRDPQTADHFALVKNVTIVQGNTILLQVLRARGVFPGFSFKYTFSVPPLVLTSFTASPANPTAGQAVTFTVTFTGGTSPFKCFFGFSDDDEFSVVSVTGQSCSATHHFDNAGTFFVTVIVRGSSTSDLVFSHLTITVSANPAPAISPAMMLTTDDNE
jgi:hypothetical protein